MMTKRQPYPAFFGFDDPPMFLGFTYGGEWNGWACPIAEVGSFKRWIALYREKWEEDPLFRIDGDDIYHTPEPDIEPEGEKLEPTRVEYDGKIYTCVDVSCALCWFQTNLIDIRTGSVDDEEIRNAREAVLPVGLDFFEMTGLDPDPGTPAEIQGWARDKWANDVLGCGKLVPYTPAAPMINGLATEDEAFMFWQDPGDPRVRDVKVGPHQVEMPATVVGSARWVAHAVGRDVESGILSLKEIGRADGLNDAVRICHHWRTDRELDEREKALHDQFEAMMAPHLEEHLRKENEQP